MNKASLAGTPFSPANGAEGECFARQFCERCERDQAFWEDPCPENSCSIAAVGTAFFPGDPEYPKEWIYDKDEIPICTAFRPAKEKPC